ncbi:MAG: enoyl-CoA hydratase-related protein [Dehalococcoidia bacterium]|nr:enoyl-CoA hydratase-related protein [Dehalococcoidia bacterium]
MSEEPRVKYDTTHDGMIAVVSLNRPRYRNALSLPTMKELDAAFQRAVDDEVVRVIILKGEGPSFSAGHDLGSPDVGERDPELMGRTDVMYARTWELDVDHYLRFRSIPKPTIAQVHGHCIFAAFMLASSMDLIFAAEDAQFLATDLEFFTMPWDLGVRKTKELLYENRFLSGLEAMDLGYVQRTFAPDDLAEGVLTYAKRVCEQEPFKLRIMKTSINQMQDMQGFTPHIISHHSAWVVSRSATRKNDTQEQAPGRRRKHSIVERAKIHEG